MDDRPRPVTGEAVRRLVQSTDPYLSCEDCFALMDRYVEARLASDASHQVWSSFDVHLSGCGACEVEVEVLTELVRASRRMH